MKYVIST